jgi:arylsulfatase
LPHGPTQPKFVAYERADVTSNTYYDWFMSDGAGAFLGAPALAGQFLATFKEFPPSQQPSSFSIDQLVEKMQRSFETSN